MKETEEENTTIALAKSQDGIEFCLWPYSNSSIYIGILNDRLSGAATEKIIHKVANAIGLTQSGHFYGTDILNNNVVHPIVAIGYKLGLHDFNYVISCLEKYSVKDSVKDS